MKSNASGMMVAIALIIALGYIFIQRMGPNGHAHKGHDHAGHDHGQHDDSSAHAGHRAHASHSSASSHGHEHVAPHGGTLAILGDEMAHLEILFDAKQGLIQAFILGPHAQKGVRIQQHHLDLTLLSQPAEHFKLEAVENPLSGETKGDSSHFSLRDDRLMGKHHMDVVIKDLHVKGVHFPQTSLHLH